MSKNEFGLHFIYHKEQEKVLFKTEKNNMIFEITDKESAEARRLDMRVFQ